MSGDLRAWDDLDLFGRETESDLEDLEQDVFHMLIEAPGSNLDAPARGIGIEDVLSSAFDSAVTSRIESQLRKDSRVAVATARITEVERESFRLDIAIEPDGDEVAGLSFVIGADGVARAVG